MIEIDAQSAVAAHAKGEAVIVDVREDGEYASGHVPGSLHLPMSRFNPAQIKGEKRKIVLICASGMRSGRACANLRPQGFEAYSLRGGIGAWSRAGGALEAAQGAVEAAALRAKLMAGGTVALGIALAAVVHPGFIVFAGIAGGRLVSLMLAAKGAATCSGSGDGTCSTPDARGKTASCPGCNAKQA